MNIKEALRVSTATIRVKNELKALDGELKKIDGVADNHRLMVANAMQAITVLENSLRPLFDEVKETPEID